MARQNNNNKIKDFRLAIIDNKMHKQLWVLKFSKTTALLYIAVALIFITAIFYSLIAFTPIRKTIPGYPDAHSKRAAIQNAIKMDSLENVIIRWELYSENLRRVINGQEPIKIDSLEWANATVYPKTREELDKRDSLLRMNVINEEQFELSNKDKRDLPIEGVHFFSPLKGVISQGYDKVIHPFIDITAPKNSVVMSVLDGTVIFAGWNDESGYTITIQHDNDIISTYKHNSKLLKKPGEKVSAGTPIAYIGSTGLLSTGEHLHFELWYKGEAIDPTKYINF